MEIMEYGRLRCGMSFCIEPLSEPDAPVRERHGYVNILDLTSHDIITAAASDKKDPVLELCARDQRLQTVSYLYVYRFVQLLESFLYLVKQILTCILQKVQDHSEALASHIIRVRDICHPAVFQIACHPPDLVRGFY